MAPSGIIRGLMRGSGHDSTSDVVRVASVPADHPYVRALHAPGLHVLPDPPVPGAPAGTWWPPEVLSREWLVANADAFDLAHVHFGTESLSLERLSAALDTLRDLSRPLVHTVHDLDHPHLTDQAHHDERLALLVGASAELLTLTDHAAATVRRRFGRRATVVAHPQLAADEWFARADGLRGGPRPGPVVGLHLRGLRANIRPGAWVAGLAVAVADRGGRLLLIVNDEVRPGTPQDAALTEIVDATRSVAVEVVRRPRPDDDGLAEELAGLDVSVLPYSHGTHSGWLELCWDLGTRVLSPAVGAIADQHREPWALQTFDGERPGTLDEALERLLEAPASPPAAERLAERRRVAAENHAVHAAVYGRALRSAGSS